MQCLITTTSNEWPFVWCIKMRRHTPIMSAPFYFADRLIPIFSEFEDHFPSIHFEWCKPCCCCSWVSANPYTIPPLLLESFCPQGPRHIDVFFGTIVVLYYPSWYDSIKYPCQYISALLKSIQQSASSKPKIHLWLWMSPPFSPCSLWTLFNKAHGSANDIKLYHITF